MAEITRRKMMTAAAGTAVSAYLLEGCAMTQKKLKIETNEAFYQADGTFDVDRAKEAYYEMMAFYDYPVVERLRGDDFWTLDFNLGIFTEVGMAGIFWINNEHYLGHEIYLLPGQMIPEHWHVKTEIAAAKMEAWHVRYGQVTLYAEGEPTPGWRDRIPQSHRDIAVARKEEVVRPGEVGYLAKAGARHSMVAGPEGAIVTEYATFHDMDALRFTHPKISL